MSFETYQSTPCVAGYWQAGKTTAPCAITENNFVHKSLSNWALNFAIGCNHACRYCYVPSASVNKLTPQLKRLGVDDPDTQWGDFVFLRTWDEKAFLTSLCAAENTPPERLKADGNRAVLLSSTTDAYQVVRHFDHQTRQNLQAHLRHVVRRSLELIRDHSTLNVRILTRSPLVREDFDLLQSLGHRVILGMSLPTLRNDLAKIYEPKAPSPSQRLQALKDAADAGIPVFVAIAPSFPESDETDLRATLQAIAAVNPLTVFHEPINVRAANVKRIHAHAERMGVQLNTHVFESRVNWQTYALNAFHTVERLATEVGLVDRLHLWPDKCLGTQASLKRLPEHERDAHRQWLERWWSRVSEWPSRPFN